MRKANTVSIELNLYGKLYSDTHTLARNLEYLMAKNVASSWSLVSTMASSYSVTTTSKCFLRLSRFILLSLTIIIPGTALSNSARISDALAAFPNNTDDF